MAIERPCPTIGNPGAAGLYLQALAMDLEGEFTRVARGFQGGSEPNALVNGFVLRKTGTSTFAPGVSGPVFNTTTATDFLETPNDIADYAGLWRYGFGIRTSAAGVEDDNTTRTFSLEAFYFDSTGTRISIATLFDRVWEPTVTASTYLCASGEFVMPAGQSAFVEFADFFAHLNTSSSINVLATSIMWAYRVGPDTQIETVS